MEREELDLLEQPCGCVDFAFGPSLRCKQHDRGAGNRRRQTPTFRATMKRRSQLNCLDLDHDHTSGLIRGLLCHRCNLALGLVENNPAWHSPAVAAYLSADSPLPGVRWDDRTLDKSERLQIRAELRRQLGARCGICQRPELTNDPTVAGQIIAQPEGESS
jgi:hypothetical protein